MQTLKTLPLAAAVALAACSTGTSHPLQQSRNVSKSQAEISGNLDAVYLALVTRARTACPRIVVEAEMLANSGRALVTLAAVRFNSTFRMEFAQVTISTNGPRLALDIAHLSEFPSFPGAIREWAHGRDAPCPSGNV